MKSNYKQLGQFIEPINIRNKDLAVDTLLGVSIQKCFMPSIANTVGTDMSKYKVVRKLQFAYGPVTSRNGDKISVALLEDYDSAIVSQAYIVFQIIDHEELDPEYLMMWFRRPEFDRYARFMSHGSARETFDWDEMCDTKLPVPSIEKQREIVKEYNTIVNRIKLNEQLNQKLEETAQALYNHWFVDFEFQNENGQPYKSSGGKMIYNEELDQEIPERWEHMYIGDIGKVVTGKTPSTKREGNFNGDIPFLTIPDMHDKLVVTKTIRNLSKIGAETQANKTLPPKSICVSCIGTGGLVVLNANSVQTNQQINSIIPNKSELINFHFFNVLQKGREIIEFGNKGSVGVNMNKSEFELLTLIKPENNVMFSFSIKIDSILDLNILYQKETHCLKDMLGLILSKMSKLESPKKEHVL